MPQRKEQKETMERVMHEFKHGELETSRGKKVKSPKQAVAIGLREAGASKYESEEENKENLKRTKQRERRAETAKDEAEGEWHDRRMQSRLGRFAVSFRTCYPGETTNAITATSMTKTTKPERKIALRSGVVSTIRPCRAFSAG
jgi:Family of unknown function (DUF6496)